MSTFAVSAVVASSDQAGYLGSNVINGFVGSGAGSRWASAGVTSATLTFDLGSAKVTNWYQLSPGGYSNAQDPSAWTWQGSADGSTGWTTLDTRSAITFTTDLRTRTFTFTNTTAYRYYRLNISASNGDSTLSLAEVWLGDGAPSSRGFGLIKYSTASAGDYTLGTLFTPAVSGFVTGVCVLGNGGTAPFTVRVYNSAGTILASATSNVDVPQGWYTVPLSTPLAVVGGTTYMAAWRLTDNFTTVAPTLPDTDNDITVPANGGVSFAGSTTHSRYTSGDGFPASFTGSTYAVTVEFERPGSASSAVSVAVPVLAGVGVVPAPTVTAGASVAVAAPVLAGTGAVPAPAVSAGTSARVTVPVLAGSGALIAPAVAISTGVTVAAPVLAGSGALVAPSVVAGGPVTVDAPVLAGVGGLVAPAVSTVTGLPGVLYVSSPSPRYSTATLGDGGVTWDADVLRVSSNSARGSSATLILTPAAVPLVINEWPIGRQSHLMPALSAANPRYSPHIDYTVDYGVVGRDHVFIDGVDVTFLRNSPTMIGETVESSPLGDDRASLEFPQIKPWDFDPANPSADVSMIVEDRPVEVIRITPEGDRVHRFDGFLSSFSDYSGDGRETYTVECEGVLAQAMHEPWEPPLFLDETDIGTLIPDALNAVPGRRWAKIPRTVTGFTSSDRGSQDMSVWQQVQNWIAPAWTTDGRQLALVRVAHGVYRLQLKAPTTTVHWTVTKGAPGVSVDLVHDANTRRDSVYGRGVAPDGGVWANWFFPFLDQFIPPLYPMAGFADMVVGTRDSDTTTGRGVTQWQRRMRDIGFPVTVDGVMNSNDAQWVGRIQRARGLTDNEILGIQTWNGTFDPGPTEVDIRAVRRPLATKAAVEPYLYAANGARVGKNPAYDSRIIRHAMPGVNFGSGIRKRDAFAPAADILSREGTTGATGTITLSTDPHEAGSSRLDIRAGHNVKVIGHRGDTVVQVASVTHGLLTSTLTVDERARDALALEAILARKREWRKNVASRRNPIQSAELDRTDTVQYESESQAGTLPRYAVNGNAGLWSVVPIFVSQVGVAKIRLEATHPMAEMVCALFSRPITPNKLASFLPNPLASSDGWYTNVDTLKAKFGCMEVFGTADSPGGYFPQQKGKGPLTGILEDSSSTLYDSGFGGVVWVALYTSRSTWVEGRIYPAVPQ